MTAKRAAPQRKPGRVGKARRSPFKAQPVVRNVSKKTTSLTPSRRIECHYFVNKGFFPKDGWLLEQVREKLQNTPGRIVHGRYDVVTPLSSAWSLKKAWPAARLDVIANAGHSSLEPGIVDKLIRATREFGREFRVVR